MIRKISRTETERHATEIVSPRRHAKPRLGAVLLLACVLIFQFAGSLHAQSSVTLSWDPITDPGLAGYKVYRSELSGVFVPPSLNGSLLTTSSFTDSSVQPGHTYYYVVTSISSTGLESGYSAQVQADIPALVTNKAPVPNAGADQTITLPATATLSASATDDGLPSGTLTYQWIVVSGSGVTLTSTNTATTKATFASAGTYTFRVIVSDGLLSASDDIIVFVNPAATTSNKPPTVNAGADQTITLPAAATLTATATDDGLPNNTLTYSWSIVSGSGVTLASTNSATTKATFAAAGTYTLRVTVSDSQLSASDDVIVVVNPASTTNTAPTVTVGPNQTITFPATATLTATATDDGQPNNTLTYSWSVVSGSGVSLSNINAPTVQVTFSAAGTYTFRVTVSDGQLTATADVTVVVNPSSSDVIITVSKGGTTLTGAIVPVYVTTTNTQVQTMELLIDGQKQALGKGTSLTYRWKTNKLPNGGHTLKANAYVGQIIAGTKTITVTLQ